MIIRCLRLFNFRNYAAQEIRLPGGLIAFTGDNGQGKTNLLEAFCVLATTKSPLVERDRELMRWGDRRTSLQAEVILEVGRGDVRHLEYGWHLEGNSLVRVMQADGVPQSAIGQWLGQLQVVAFFPHDLTLLTGEPEGRRRFLNLELGKTRPAYFADSIKYKRAMQQRNALLKQDIESRYKKRPPPVPTDPGTLKEWNRQIVGYGARLLTERYAFFSALAPLLTEVHSRLTGLAEPFTIEYLPGLSSLKIAREQPNGGNFTALFWSSLENDFREDTRRGVTTSGPHRDDLCFKLGDMDLRRYGSQGQQRMAVLALKLALAYWVKETTGEPPILLLDDALSELDATRRGLLLTEARQFSQCIVTATDAAFVRDADAIYTVSQGQLLPDKAG